MNSTTPTSSPGPKIYRLELPEEGLPSSSDTAAAVQAKGSRALLTTAAPTLKASPSKGGYQTQLIAYMNAVLLAAVALASDQSKLNGSQNTVSNDLVQLSNQIAKQVAEQVAAYEKAEEEASHQGFFGKIFGDIMGGLSILVGALTGDPVMLLGGVFLLTMQMSGGSSALQNALSGLPDWAQPLVMTAVAAGCTIALCGIGQALNSYFTEEAAEVAQSQAAAAQPKNFFSARTMASMGSQVATAVNPFIPLIEVILKHTGTGQDKANFVAQIVGMAIAMGAAIYVSMFVKSPVWSLRTIQMGSKTEAFLDGATSILRLARSGTMITSGYFNVQAGRATLGAAGTLDQMADAESAYSKINVDAEMANSAISADIERYKAVNQDYADINKRWDDLVAPYVMMTEVLG